MTINGQHFLDVLVVFYNVTIYSQNVFALFIVEITLYYIKLWQKVDKNATRFTKQAHIIEQLSPMVWTKLRNSF